jgi:hypothetical protein
MGAEKSVRWKETSMNLCGEAGIGTFVGCLIFFLAIMVLLVIQCGRRIMTENKESKSKGHEIAPQKYEEIYL